MHSKIFNVSADFKSIDKLIKNLPVFSLTKHQDITLVLFEVLSNILEHAIFGNEKNEIFEGKIKKSLQKINLSFFHQSNKLEVIIHYRRIPYTKKSRCFFGGNGKKIIKYLCKNYSYGNIGKMAYEKISFCLK
ncbi:hypothetical protein BKH41_06430 [Helicobacter sp. 12S02232-10]|uniref:hypothetical protein n=1 Tax=Helicobacter sp. 12S02232-10 TaxID=1476197 RepID=UPI000BA78C0B|nr:hypothetical protein [Helicobacter sp. 12S02232-10]PAF47900.1 hypothetical protein BKH41_06430 [Helicobacter sp. 12S02232-10]